MGHALLTLLVLCPLLASGLSFLCPPTWARGWVLAGGGLFVAALTAVTAMMLVSAGPLVWSVTGERGPATLRADNLSLLFLWLMGVTVLSGLLAQEYGQGQRRAALTAEAVPGPEEDAAAGGGSAMGSAALLSETGSGEAADSSQHLLRPDAAKLDAAAGVAFRDYGWPLFALGLSAALMLAGSWSQRVLLAFLAALAPILLVVLGRGKEGPVSAPAPTDATLNGRCGDRPLLKGAGTATRPYSTMDEPGSRRKALALVAPLLVGAAVLAIGRSEILPDLRLPALNAAVQPTVERTVFSVFLSLVGCALLSGLALRSAWASSLARVLDTPALMLAHFGGLFLAASYLGGRLLLGRHDEAYLVAQVFRFWPGLSTGDWFLAGCAAAIVAGLAHLGRCRSGRDLLAGLFLLELAYGFAALGLYLEGSKIALAAWVYLQVGYATALICAWMGASLVFQDGREPLRRPLAAGVPAPAQPEPQAGAMDGEMVAAARGDSVGRTAFILGVAGVVGLPPFAGFWAKWLMVAAAVERFPAIGWVVLLPFFVEGVIVLRWLGGEFGPDRKLDLDLLEPPPETRRPLPSLLLIGAILLHSGGGLVLTWAARGIL